MPRYLQTTLGNRVHLGRPIYDDEAGGWGQPTSTLCGLDATVWTKAYVRAAAWSTRKPGAVCDMCDRTAMWESIISLGVK